MKLYVLVESCSIAQGRSLCWIWKFRGFLMTQYNALFSFVVSYFKSQVQHTRGNQNYFLCNRPQCLYLPRCNYRKNSRNRIYDFSHVINHFVWISNNLIYEIWTKTIKINAFDTLAESSYTMDTYLNDFPCHYS